MNMYLFLMPKTKELVIKKKILPIFKAEVQI